MAAKWQVHTCGRRDPAALRSRCSSAVVHEFCALFSTHVWRLERCSCRTECRLAAILGRKNEDDTGLHSLDSKVRDALSSQKSSVALGIRATLKDDNADSLQEVVSAGAP